MRGLPFTAIDGTEAEHRETRGALWAVSGLRLVYPQLFLRGAATGTYTFLGDWAAIQKRNEANDVDGSFDALFANVEGYTPSRGVYYASGAEAAAAAGEEGEGEGEAVTRIVTAPSSPEAQQAPAAAPMSPPPTGGGGAAGGGAGASSMPQSPPPSARPPPRWEACRSSRGETYWFNRATGESSWVDPRVAEGDWLPQTDSRGRQYFYNRCVGKGVGWEAGAGAAAGAAGMPGPPLPPAAPAHPRRPTYPSLVPPRHPLQTNGQVGVAPAQRVRGCGWGVPGGGGG